MTPNVNRYKKNTHLFHLFFAATAKPENALLRSTLHDFGEYVGNCLPKYVQKVQLTYNNELEVLIHPEGIIPIMTFLKDHHNAQYLNIVDIAGVDVPNRPYRFEVSFCLFLVFIHLLTAFRYTNSFFCGIEFESKFNL